MHNRRMSTLVMLRALSDVQTIAAFFAYTYLRFYWQTIQLISLCINILHSYDRTLGCASLWHCLNNWPPGATMCRLDKRHGCGLEQALTARMVSIDGSTLPYRSCGNLPNGVAFKRPHAQRANSCANGYPLPILANLGWIRTAPIEHSERCTKTRCRGVL